MIETVITVSLIFAFVNLGVFFVREQQEKTLLKEAKYKIIEVFYGYSEKAMLEKRIYRIKADYKEKTLTILTRNTIQTVKLPEKLNYITIYEKIPQTTFTSLITDNGNITPSFTIYIFDSKNIARYRISFYGFEILKYMKINVYRNLKDENATYDNIENFHRRWDTKNPYWKEE